MKSPSGLALVVQLGAATTLIVAAFSMANPVLAVLLQQAGYSTTVVGAFAMVPFLLIALLIPLVPDAMARWGLVRTYRVGAALQVLGVLAYALGDDLPLWTLGSVLGGIGAAALWNATEALLAREAPPAYRGRVMGLYQTALGGALAVGPFVPALLGWSPEAVLWGATGLVATCCLLALLAPAHASVEPPRHEHASTWQALRAVPALSFIAFAGGAFEAGLSSVSAAYASSQGLSLATAATVAGAIGVGSFLCQYPAGAAADRFDVRRVVTVGAVLLLAASVLVAAAERASWVLWPVGLVWGGVGGALYTLTMIQVAHHFDGRATAGGAAAMITGYTVGASVGPVASGAALQFAGVLGLSAGLSALAAAALVAARRIRS